MVSIVVVAEAGGDAEVVCDLVDRLLVEVGQIVREELAARRTWSGLDGTATFTKWTLIDDLFDNLKKGDRRPKYLGYVEGKPQRNHYAICRKAILLAMNLRKQQPVHAILMHRDLDNDPERLTGMRQARDEVRDEMVIVLATPDRMTEAWILNGFIPKNQAERKKLTEWKRKIGFDPTTQAERVTGKGDRDPKALVRTLIGKDIERKRCCWNETQITELRQRGKQTKLEAFLDEVESRLLPLFLNPPQQSL